MSALSRPSTGAPRREPPRRERPSLRVVDRTARPPARPRPDRRRGKYAAWVLLFVVVLGGNVAVQAQTTKGQFELDQLQREAHQRQDDYQRLRLEVAELEAPQRVVTRAQEIGMIEAGAVTYLVPTPTTSAASQVASLAEAEPITEAAQGWAKVKPHLDDRR